MKNGKVLFFLLTMGALFMANPTTSVAREYPAAGGRLILKFSPTLGINVGISVRIDGGGMEPFTKGHVFQRYLAPGRHFVQVIPNGRFHDAGGVTLDVRGGETYAFAIKYPNRIELQPIGIRHHGHY